MDFPVLVSGACTIGVAPVHRIYTEQLKISSFCIMAIKKTFIPIVHSVHLKVLKESYQNMNTVLLAIQYTNHQWHSCGDLKVIGMLMGMQGGFTKYCCFLCLWNSGAADDHYSVCDWPLINTYDMLSVCQYTHIIGLLL